jgi:sugar phosphate isomerase/epimerase
MRLGISSHAFKWNIGQPNAAPEVPLSPLTLLDKAVELQVDVVQIADNLPIHTFTEEVIEAFGNIARDRGITVELAMRGHEPEMFRQYLEIAKMADAQLVRTAFPRPEGEAGIAAVIKDVKTIIGEFESANVCIAFENYDHFPIRELAQIINGVDSPNVGSCIDPGNSLSCNEDTMRVVDVLGPMALNLHVKDIAIFREPHHMGFWVEGRACGQGQIDFPWLIDCVRAFNPHANAILENWIPWQGSLEASLSIEDQWIAESIRYLRTLIPA